MSSFERKAADTLADAVERHRRRFPHLTQQNALLLRVERDFDRAARTATTTERDLELHKSALCAICRAFKMYECDVPEGWSERCALLHTNITGFSSL